MTEVKLTVADVVGCQMSLMNIADKELPVVTAWKLAKVVRVLDPEFTAYEKIRIDLVKQYGEQDENMDWQVTKENNEAFQAEVQKVLEEEVVVDFPLISLEMLGEGEFRPRDLALAWFIFEEEHNESDQSDKEGQ